MTNFIMSFNNCYIRIKISFFTNIVFEINDIFRTGITETENSLRIITNDPARPMQTVRVTAIVTE